jgi:hypothetical protein
LGQKDMESRTRGRHQLKKQAKSCTSDVWKPPFELRFKKEAISHREQVHFLFT